MARRNNPQYVIKSYKKKRKLLPFIIWGLAGIIFASGVLLIYFWFMGGNSSVNPETGISAEATPGSGFS